MWSRIRPWADSFVFKDEYLKIYMAHDLYWLCAFFIMREPILIYEDKWKDSLEFNEEYHVYHVDGERYTSVSKMIKKFHKPFNKNIATWVAKSETKKTGKTVSRGMILKQWADKGKKAAERGTAVHNYAESYVRDAYIFKEYFIQTPYSDDPQCQAVIDFWNDLDPKYKVVALEQKMYTEKYKFAGTADVILLNTETNKLLIVDYKTNETLFKEYGNNLYEPFSDLPEHSFNKYALQFSHYQLMLEEAGYEVEDRWLVWLRPDEEKSYQLLPVDDYTEKLKEYYEPKDDKESYLYFT